MYALNLNEENRILSATFEEFAAEGQPLVDTLPEGDISDYLYIDGEFAYDPLPEPEEPGATDNEVLNTLLGVTV